MEKKGHCIFIYIFSFLCLLLSYLSPLCSQKASATPQNHHITAIFAFGDSILDPGNNDRLTTPFRGDHPPYGRDFNGGIATGRLTNGKLITDIIISTLGIKHSLPAYFDPKITNHDLLTGVSFASAGSGLDDMTANIDGVTHMSTQLTHFQQCLARIKATVGNATATHIIQNALFTISAVTNDMLLNFYDIPTRRLKYSMSAYHDFLLLNLQSIVKSLYQMGGRKISISGLPPIGCLPVQVTVGSFIPGPHLLERSCVDQQNVDSHAYNTKLQSYITRWQPMFPGAKFGYADIYNPLMDMILNPMNYGFEQTLRGCCGTGYIEMGALCNSTAMPICHDPSKYMFFDAVHPTQVTYQNVANVFQKTVLPGLNN